MRMQIASFGGRSGLYSARPIDCYAVEGTLPGATVGG